MVARRCHSSHDRRKDRVESLVHFSQAVRGADNSGVDTDSRQRHAGCATDKIPEHDYIQTGNKGVNQLVGTDGRGITEQTLRFLQLGR